MAHLEEDIIERAKNTDMIALLESEEGFSFKSTYGEREFKCIEHNSLVVNGNRRRWYWNSRQVGGNNAIDYLVKIRGMNFRDAVLHLVGDREQTAYTPIRKAVTENVSVSKPVRFVLPEQAHFPDGRRNYSNIIAYLNKGRGIDMNIINTLIASGQIYQGVQYNGLHIVGYNDEGIAFYRFNDNRDADAIYELNNVVGQDGCCMLFVNNMIYSFASYLVIEDDYQNYEKIKAAIEKYQLAIDMTQTLDSLYSQLYLRAYNTINFTSNCSKDQILLQMTAVYAYKDKDELARSGYYVSEADKPNVFISYSHNDKIIVKDVKDRIVMCGLNVWFDENCIAVGKHIVNEFMDGITKSDYAIIFASKSTVSSVYSKAEIQNLFVKVLNNEIKLFIVKLDDVDMNSIFPNLKNYKYYDFYQEHNIDKLVMSIVDFVKKK